MSHISVTNLQRVIRPAPREVLDAERRSYAAFATHDAEPCLREVFDDLYQIWHSYNEEFFYGKLRAPHFTVGRVPPQSIRLLQTVDRLGGRSANYLPPRPGPWHASDHCQPLARSRNAAIPPRHCASRDSPSVPV